MNPRTTAARSAPLLPVDAAHSQEARFFDVIQDLCNSAMDQALGIEKASLAPIAGLNSCLRGMVERALDFSPVFGNHLQAVSQVFAFSMELQLNFLNLLAPPFWSHASQGEVISAGQHQPAADELAQSMDVAIGEPYSATPICIVASSPEVAAVSIQAITPMRKRRAAERVAERQGSRYRGAGERVSVSYGRRKAHG
jgi:hypothetical protein